MASNPLEKKSDYRKSLGSYELPDGSIIEIRAGYDVEIPNRGYIADEVSAWDGDEKLGSGLITRI